MPSFIMPSNSTSNPQPRRTSIREEKKLNHNAEIVEANKKLSKKTSCKISCEPALFATRFDLFWGLIFFQHPAISECCVLGLPDKAYGEAVCAIVIPDSSIKRKRDEELKPALSLQELSSWAKEKLAPYKIPTHLLLWDSLPHNAMGKVNKKELKKSLADQLSRDELINGPPHHAGSR